MYKALTKNKRKQRQDIRAWKHDWTTADKSGTLSRQTHGCGCGIFTLISMNLIRNGHRLRKESYVQELLYDRNSRKKLVWTIWMPGLGRNFVRWQPGTQRHTAAATYTRWATKKRPKGTTQKKKRRKEGRLIPEGAKMQSLVKWYGNDQANKDTGRRQKWNAKSVAGEECGKRIATRIEQPPRKRGDRENPDSNLG